MDELEQQDPHRLPEPEPLDPVEYERAAAPEPIETTDRFPEAGDLPEAPSHEGITNREPVALPDLIEHTRPGPGDGIELPEPPEHAQPSSHELPEPIEHAQPAEEGVELPEPPEHTLSAAGEGVELPEPPELVNRDVSEPPELVEQYTPRLSELPEPPEMIINETKSYDASRLKFHDDVFTSDTHWG